MILRLALGSLMARALTVGMTILAIALSVALFLGVEKVRTGAKASFADTISGTDLIVGARSGAVQLLLYSVFRIGNATNNITWESYNDIAARPEVDWIVPISLGDSHRQFRVMGTTPSGRMWRRRLAILWGTRLLWPMALRPLSRMKTSRSASLASLRKRARLWTAR